MVEALAGDPIEDEVAWTPNLVPVPPEGSLTDFIIEAATQAVAACNEAIEQRGYTSPRAQILAEQRDRHLAQAWFDRNPEARAQVVFAGLGMEEAEVTRDAEADAAAMAKAVRLSVDRIMTDEERARANLIREDYLRSRRAA